MIRRICTQCPPPEAIAMTFRGLLLSMDRRKPEKRLRQDGEPLSNVKLSSSRKPSGIRILCSSGSREHDRYSVLEAREVEKPHAMSAHQK